MEPHPDPPTPKPPTLTAPPYQLAKHIREVTGALPASLTDEAIVGSEAKGSAVTAELEDAKCNSTSSSSSSSTSTSQVESPAKAPGESSTSLVGPGVDTSLDGPTPPKAKVSERHKRTPEHTPTVSFLLVHLDHHPGIASEAMGHI
jgi:hypothetical protein